MGNTKFFILILLFVHLTVKAQEKNPWVEKPVIHNLDEKYDDEKAVIINDSRLIECMIKRSGSHTIETDHRIIRVNSDAGIEQFNKVYIPLDPGEELEQVKVRTISPDNEIREFDKANLKELTNVDGFNNYKIFAVEGLVKGGEIEYFYIVKRKIKSYGREIFQRDIPIIEANFALTWTEGFEFVTRSYNGFPHAEGEGNSRVIMAKDIPALTEEGYSSYTSRLMRVDYKIESNPVKKNIINWKSLSTNIYNNLYQSKGTSVAGKFVNGLDLKNMNEFDQIMTVEKTLKETFTIKQSGSEEYSDLTSVIKNRAGNKLGIARTYVKCLEALGVDFEIVFTCSRFSGSIDKGFAHGMDLEAILFYLPEHKRFISPWLTHMRFGPAPNVFERNTGLFIKTYLYRSLLKYDGYEIKTIPILEAQYNHQGVNAELTFNESLDQVEVKLENYSQGHRAFMFREIYANTQDDDHEYFKTNIINSAIEDADYSSFEVRNANQNLSANSEEYFNVFTEFTSNSLMEYAGNDILLSVGKVIGKQVEMYEEKDRVTDVILYDMKMYKHTITVNLPEGYKVQALDQLEINNKVEKDGEVIMQFVSDYVLGEDQLVITVIEEYLVLELDKKFYNDYRRVVNSAADFNKIVLVLEPES